MKYDLEVDGATWTHSQFKYRVVYHLGIISQKPVWNGIEGRYYYTTPGEEALRARNSQKIRDYMNQLHVEGHYAIDEMADGVVFIYCNEWIEDAILKLTCPEDRHFLKPAFIERLNETQQVQSPDSQQV